MDRAISNMELRKRLSPKDSSESASPRPVKRARRTPQEIREEKIKDLLDLKAKMLSEQIASCQPRLELYPAVCYKGRSPGKETADLLRCRQEYCQKYFHAAGGEAHGESLKDVSCGACSPDNRECASPRCKTPDDDDLSKCPHEFCDLFYHRTCLEELNADIIELNKSVKGIVAKEGYNFSPPLLDESTCPRHRCSTCVNARRFPSNGQAVCAIDLRLVTCLNCPSAVHNNPRCLPAAYRINEFNPLLMTCCKHPAGGNAEEQAEAEKMVDADGERVFYLFNTYDPTCIMCGKHTRPGKPADPVVRCATCAIALHEDCASKKNASNIRVFADGQCSRCRLNYRPQFFVGDIVWFLWWKGDYGDRFQPWPAEVVSFADLPPPVQYLKKLLKADCSTVLLRYCGSKRLALAPTRDIVHFAVPEYRKEKKWRCSTRTSKQVLHGPLKKAISTGSTRDGIMEKVEQDVASIFFVNYPSQYKYITKHKFSDSRVTRAKLVTEYVYETSYCLWSQWRDPKLQLKFVGFGYGAFALKAFKQGKVIGQYVGEVISKSELEERNGAAFITNETNYYYMGLDGEAYHCYLDARHYGNLTRFINHSCDPNCRIEAYQKQVKDKWTSVMVFVAGRDIKAGEELTFAYNYTCGIGQSEECKCGAEKCSGKLRIEK